MSVPVLRCAVLLGVALLVGCAGDRPAPAGGAAAPPAASTTGTDASGLTEFQLKNGIGPITEEVVLGAPDRELAEEGKKTFEQKCSACHKMGERYVGPPLGGIVARFGPTFVMNMALNPEGMYTRHPDVKKLLGEYMTQMPNQQLTPADARAIVEYLRSQPASGS
jgi:mono/diheme cytochrome c family protein